MTPASDVISEADRPLRADAARNRELILETAAVVFAEHGLDAGYDEIARRAGIGVGTVYRRFPERVELVRALFRSRLDEIAAFGEQAVQEPDGWAGLTWFLERLVERQVADRGLKEVMAQTLVDDQQVADGRKRLELVFEGLVERAQAQGTLRPDVRAIDLGVQLVALSAITTEEEPELWRRYLALALDGLRAGAVTSPLPLDAPADQAVPELMRRMCGR
ncbi:hypothetical protein ASD11_01500 [Aeromicrobium sp. Root495]|uniref:TetR/AcrR family transcriptional regulator n=1 Tax=Aeromicrobium sp. Root495 TaxID=1736550 RepID=UPI0006F4D7D6|nr:TetR/AcrR family transcriptional regulator [Aeromicrobium sp. Root495]KQY58369.1 hypothetical protein ASD11_01500 [Aeromicrobium sp. Root495]